MTLDRAQSLMAGTCAGAEMCKKSQNCMSFNGQNLNLNFHWHRMDKL